MNSEKHTVYATVSVSNGKVNSATATNLNIIFDSLEGQILNDHYKVGEFLD